MFRVKRAVRVAALELIEEETFSMNKKLMAVAVAAAVSAPGLALAQGVSNTPTSIVPSPGVATSNGITLYGRLDETIMFDKYSASGNGQIGDFKKSDLFTAGNAMGFRGREDLGGGTSVWFQLEIGVWPDARQEAGATTGNNWGGRNSGVGFTSGAGDILLGVWDTPYKVIDGVWNSVTSGGFSAAGVTMNMSDSTGSLNNPLCTNTVSNATGTLVSSSANAVCVTEATASNTAFSRRINNSVQYWSPIMAGFQVKLMTALANYQSPPVTGGPSATTVFPNGMVKPKEYSASATWVRGPLSLGVGYDFHQGLHPNTAAGGITDPKDTAVQVGAKWNFGPGEIGIGYEQIKFGNNAAAGVTDNGMTVPSYVVNGRWNIGPGAVWASYSKTDAKSCSTLTVIGTAACGVQVKEASIGYDYVLSKRTKMYVAYNKIDNGMNSATTGSTYYYIAGPAGNVGNGTSGSISPGTDVTTFGLGVQHVF
jgi:predicted porin